MALEVSRPKISLLPEHLIDQIKAGEVVERPASIIKELVENSIDAKSSRIEISLIDNGLSLIRIRDNGIGMNSSDLPMAFCRHATSKITTFEDLYRLISYGFRGEALASVAAVSRVECESTPSEDQDAGGRLELEAGVVTQHLPLKGREQGTSITVRDLFFNTPARLKFIKSGGSEKNALTRMIDCFLLSHPEITFSIQWDQEDRNLYESVTNEKERIWNVIGKRGHTIDELISFEKSHLGYRVHGFISTYTMKSQNSRNQFLFANGRTFQDKSFHHAIMNSMERYWGRESGAYVLFIDSPADQIDVNVHPNKTQVKFSEANMLYSLVIAAIKDSLPQISREPETSFQFDQHHLSSHIPAFSTLSRPELPSFSGQVSSNSRLAKWLDNELMLILNKENNPFFFEVKNALLHFLKNDIFQSATLKDDDIIPLLIAHRFNHPVSKSQIEDLKRLGFTLEEIAPDQFLLKSLPEKLNFLKNKNFLDQPLLSFLAKEDLSFEPSLLSEGEILSFFDLLDIDQTSTIKALTAKDYWEKVR